MLRQMFCTSRTMLSDAAIENLDIMRQSDSNNLRDGIGAVLVKSGTRFLFLCEGRDDKI